MVPRSLCERMDATEFLQKLFYCLFPLAARRRRPTAFRPKVSAPLNTKKRPRRNLGSGSDRYQRIRRIHCRANYMDLKKKILRAISYDMNRTLVVWCPEHVVPNDYVNTMIHQYGEVDHFIDNFSGMQHDSKRKIWYGTIVQYSNAEEANAAMKNMPMQCKYIKVIPLSFILSILVDCEMMYGELGQNSASTVIVSGRRSIKPRKTFYLYEELAEFGSIVKLFFDYRNTASGVFCIVTYSHFTHAYLAMMMLHGQNYCDEVLLSAEIEEKREEIVEQAKKSLMMAMESYF